MMKVMKISASFVSHLLFHRKLFLAFSSSTSPLRSYSRGEFRIVHRTPASWGVFLLMAALLTSVKNRKGSTFLSENIHSISNRSSNDCHRVSIQARPRNTHHSCRGLETRGNTATTSPGSVCNVHLCSNI